MSTASETSVAQDRDEIIRALGRRGYNARQCAYVPDGPSRGWHIGYGPQPGKVGDGGMAHGRDLAEIRRTIDALPYPKSRKE